MRSLSSVNRCVTIFTIFCASTVFALGAKKPATPGSGEVRAADPSVAPGVNDEKKSNEANSKNEEDADQPDRVSGAGVLSGGVAGDSDKDDTKDGTDDETADETETVEKPPSSEPAVLALKPRPWVAPDYSNQEGALGYSPGVFDIPPGLEERVKFWTDVYTKITTSEGYLHDTKYINLVYEKIDFRTIENDTALSDRKKRKARMNLVKERKAEWKKILLKLATVKDPTSLQGEELRIWKFFESVSESNKFRNASERSRLRFQLGQSDRFKQGVFYSGRYLKKMQEIFREEGLPVELTRLPFVESSFNLYARSKVGASGIWQFMRGTARLYKLKMNSQMDQRNDPLTVTRAAARLLRDNYTMLEAWPLAVTAYNHGPGGVRRIVQKIKSNNLQDIIDQATSRRFGFASENFYACFLAALSVEREATKHFPDVAWSGELNYVDVELPRPVRFSVLLDFFGGEKDLADLYNPHFSWRVKRGFRQFEKGTVLRVPPEGKEKFLAMIDREPVGKQIARADLSGAEGTYEVEPGDTYSDIAKRLGVGLRDLMDANPEIPPRGLRQGQKLVVPGGN